MVAFFSENRRPPRIKSGASYFRKMLQEGIQSVRPGPASGLALAIGLVAATAVLLHLGELRLEGIEIGDLRFGSLGLVGELRQLGVEIGLVLPNRRQRSGIATGLRAVRPQIVRRGDLLVGGEDALALLHGERLLAARHLGTQLGGLAI